MRFRRWLTGAAAGALLAGLSGGVPGLAQSSNSFTIGVDHFDPDNQQFGPNGPLPGGRLFLYTDFFTDTINVHRGDTIDFHFAIPDHYLSVAADETAARQGFPLAYPDADDRAAIGTGASKIGLGPAAGAAGGPNACGDTPGQACSFTGGNAPVGGPEFRPDGSFSQDWFVTVNAGPGAYTYFCHLHPGMRGTVTVVPSTTPLQTQAEIDAAANDQFAADKREGEAAYAAAQTPVFTGGGPGTRTYHVHVGLTTDDRHVAIHDMLPAALSNLVSGDVVQYDWEFNVVHTVGFYNAGPQLPEPFGYDCNPKYVSFPPPPASPFPVPSCTEIENGFPEFVGDPGTRAPGAGLNMARGADSGLLAGADYGPYYGLTGPSSWSLTTAQRGTYKYKCTLHDWMIGYLVVSSSN